MLSKNGLNRTTVISLIPSAEDKEIMLKITDYAYDEKSGSLIVAGIYKDRSVTLQLHDETLDLNLYPNSFGKRFFYYDKHVFFLDDASDVEGSFN